MMSTYLVGVFTGIFLPVVLSYAQVQPSGSGRPIVNLSGFGSVQVCVFGSVSRIACDILVSFCFVNLRLCYNSLLYKFSSIG